LAVAASISELAHYIACDVFIEPELSVELFLLPDPLTDLHNRSGIDAFKTSNLSLIQSEKNLGDSTSQYCMQLFLTRNPEPDLQQDATLRMLG
jgi:hypothetical protein